MTSLEHSTIRIELCEEDRILIRKMVSFLEELAETTDLKLLAKSVIDQHSPGFD